MAFQVSPGIQIREIDLTTVTPAVSSTEGAIAGVFKWGPVDQLILVDSENTLVQRFGKPTNDTFETFFTASNFLSYGNKLFVVRTANTTSSNNEVAAWNALANVGVVSSRETFNVKNEDNYEDITFSDTDLLYVAKCPGATGNSLKISVCDSANAYNRTLTLQTANTTEPTDIFASGTLTINVGSNTATVLVSNTANGTATIANTLANNTLQALSLGDIIELGNSTIGTQFVRITSFLVSNGTGNVTVTDVTGFLPIDDGDDRLFRITFDNVLNLSTNISETSVERYWEYFNAVQRAPTVSRHTLAFGNTAAVDELHVVVADEDGQFTGVPGTIVEVFENLSRATDAKREDGTGIFYVEFLNLNSQFVWFANHRSGAPANTSPLITSSTNQKPLTLSFQDGSDGASETALPISDLTRGYDFLRSSEDVDVSLILAGKARGGTHGEQVANYIIDNIANVRRDCMVFVSPDRSDVVRNVSKNEAPAIRTFRQALRSTSFAVLDTGYKYQYDKFNDIYRYVPLNGDLAGAAVFTDESRDPWFSPAGFNRGQIKNIIKLAYNPGKADRDFLYKESVNPVVTFPGQGTVLFGDKTLASLPSAFDRINVRRLFIVLEKAIARSAKSLLFEFNDEFTRAQFKNVVEPFLRDVQGRRGITAFKVVCDETNNTPEIIDRNEFVGDIFVKPARSINFIQLNFVAVRTGVEFSEIVGNF